VKSPLLIPAVCLTLILDCFVWSAALPVEVHRDVYLMGTRASLRTYAPDRQSGLTRMESFLRILEDTERELSTWRVDSVISRLNRQPVGLDLALNETLCSLFVELRTWNHRTDGAFDPAIGTLVEAWGLHAGGSRPSSRALQAALKRAGFEYLDFDDENCFVTRKRAALIDVGAFGKGDALDRVFDYSAAAGIYGWMIDLGGQIMVHGTPPGRESWSVDLAHPFNRSQPVLKIELREGSLATSGGSERDLEVGDERIGHILNPRTGHPIRRNAAVTVWHPQALAADILSTALYVMGPDEGLAWAENWGVAAAFLIAGTESHVEVRASSLFANNFLRD